jgi:cell division septation protein DedD
LLSYISPQLAGAEAAKLGLFNKTTTVYDTDGKISGEVVVRADGKAVKGTFLSGQPMSQRDLLAYSGAIDDKKAHVSRSDNFIDPDSGQVVTKTVMSDGKERFTAGGKPYTGSTEALVPEAKFSDAENRRVSDAITALRKEYPNPTQDQVQQALVAARVPNRRIELEMGLKPGSLGTGTGRQAIGGAPAEVKTQPAEVKTQPATTQAPTTTAPATKQEPVITTETQPQKPTPRPPRQGESKTEYDAYVKGEDEAYQKRLEAFQNRVKLEQKEAQEFREKRFEIQSSLSGLRNSIDVLDKGEHNLGPTFNTKDVGQSLPKVQQWLGEAFGTDQSANTTKLLSIMNRDGLQGIKNSMGPAISNFDVETWMKNNPVKPNMPPEAIKAWFVKTHNAMLAEAEAKKQNALKHGMIESGFDLGKPVSGDKRPSLDSFKR